MHPPVALVVNTHLPEALAELEPPPHLLAPLPEAAAVLAVAVEVAVAAAPEEAVAVATMAVAAATARGLPAPPEGAMAGGLT